MDNEKIYEVEKIEFIFYDYLSFPKAERTSFYITLLNIPLLLSDFDKKYSSFLYGLTLKLKNHKGEIKGTEIIMITPESEVCFFYYHYKVLFLLDLSHSMMAIYDFDEKNLIYQKIVSNLKLTVENLLLFEKEIFSLKFQKIIFKPKLVFSFVTTNDEDFTILNHEMYLDLQNFDNYFSNCILKKFWSNMKTTATKTTYPIPPIASLDSHLVCEVANLNNMNKYIATQKILFNKMLEEGFYILDLLPLNATPILFLFTDSVLDIPEIGKYNSTLMQLGRIDINLQIVDLSPNFLHTKIVSPAYLNNVDLMKYIAKFAGGNYFTIDYIHSFLIGGKDKKKYSYEPQNILNLNFEGGETIPLLSGENSEHFAFCKCCDKSLNTFFCRKPYMEVDKTIKKYVVTKEILEKLMEKEHLFRIVEVSNDSTNMRFIQKEVMATYSVKIPYDLIIEARIRENFQYKKKSAKNEKNKNITIFEINLFSDVFLKYKITKKEKSTTNPQNSTTTSLFSEKEEYIITLEVYGSINSFSSLKKEINSYSNVENRGRNFQEFLQEIINTDKIIEYFWSNFSEEKDFQTEKDNYIKNNQILWNKLGQVSIHAWHRFFNVELIELLIQNNPEKIYDKIVVPFFQKKAKTFFISNIYKSFIEDQIYKFCDIVNTELKLGIKLISKSLNNSNKKYINGFMILKFDWIFENFCSINVGFFQSFHHTRTKFMNKFIEDLYNSTKNNEIVIEISFRHLTSIIPKEIDSSSELQINTSFSCNKPMSKKKIGKYFLKKDLENVKKDNGSIFTYRASKKLIDLFLHKKMERYSIPCEFCLLMSIKFLILQRIKENFTIVKWNIETMTFIAKIKIRKLINVNDLSSIETKDCYLLYSITNSPNEREIITELSVEPNSGFFVNEFMDGSYRIYDEKNYLSSITKYFKNSELQIIDWIQSFSYIISNAIKIKLNKEKDFSQLRNQFDTNFLYKDIINTSDKFKEELVLFSSNFFDFKKKRLSSNSFLRMLSPLEERQFQIKAPSNMVLSKVKSFIANIEKLYKLIIDMLTDFEDYQIVDKNDNVYFGKIFSKTNIIFISILPWNKILSQIPLKEQELVNFKEINLPISFSYISIDTLKEIDYSLDDMLKEKESLRTIEKGKLQFGGENEQQTNYTSKKMIKYWNSNHSPNKERPDSFNKFLNCLYSFIVFNINLIIKHNNIIL